MGNQKVTFKKTQNSKGNRYEVYIAPSKSIALDFLRSTDVREERVYFIVETPEGNFGRDLIMIYDETRQTNIELAPRHPLTDFSKSETHCARCGYTVLPMGSNPYPNADVHIIILDQLKKCGSGFYCTRCRTLWCAFCAELDENKATCGLCGQEIKVFTE